jgi:hypothetical protein
VLSSLKAAFLCGLAAVAVADSAGRPVFTMCERRASWVKQSCPDGTLVKDLSYSALSVLDDGTAKERTWAVAACMNPTHAWDWKPPSGSTLRTFRAEPTAYGRFTQLLDDPNLKRVTSFRNAGPGVGDYELEIAHASGTQRISVVSLLPEHVELRRDPTLLRLICAAKQVAGIPEPRWCRASKF